jgi:hypothetical protein
MEIFAIPAVALSPSPGSRKKLLAAAIVAPKQLYARELLQQQCSVERAG